jgi:para-nitrobenzyl esterase
MVWIHGGAFVLGSGSDPGYDGAALARRGDVVVVTLNYRLGAFGFLHLADLDPAFPDSGNLGILDQIAALEWVQANIEAFGGDAGNVTIFGESAGGMSVGTLLGAPGARGLFHKAIPESGAAHNASPAAHAHTITQQVLAELDVATVAELQAVPAERLLEVQQHFVEGTFGDLDGAAGSAVRLPFQPVVDGVTLPSSPLDAVAAGNAAGIPVLIGTNLDEWRLFQFLDQSPVDEDVLERRFAKMFGDAAEADAVYRDALPDAPPSDRFGAAVTDLVFRQPSYRLAEALLGQGSAVYSYLFTWATPAMGGILGSCHGLEVPFVFGNLSPDGLGFLLGDQPPTSLVDIVQGAWLAFARTGDPSHDGVGTWPTYDTDARPTMRLDVTPAVIEDPEAGRRRFWLDHL